MHVIDRRTLLTGSLVLPAAYLGITPTRAVDARAGRRLLLSAPRAFDGATG